ncbi:DUF4367 domain-containing protein [Dorea longicatena]|nr:DUF4367 domain-containing protein [Dorea longicatena]NSC57297.1 DUF4367 domain-containing protein [Dorea longicatena]NSD09649.1 DUF4367 domain-containing protein [Dorea longicatena]NSF13059.1 DUF4367 domain-containing protein [Dorea longicatena]
MNNEKDEMKECIAREFEEIAKEEEESLEKDTSLVVPEGTKEAVFARLKEQMREYQREQAENEAREREEAINNLSEEDRKALELGRKMLKAEVGTADTSEKKVHYRRKPLKIYLALAAVIVCVLAMGITSMGGPERVVRMVRQAVGDRDVEQVDSNKTDKQNKIIEGEAEEEAYQKIRDTFDTDVVKVFVCLPDMKFDTMNLDESKQVAEMYYSYDGETIGYIINMPYRDSSWGVDFEDSVEKKYSKEIHKCKINITLYEIEDSNVPKCVAKFKYGNIEYMLMGTMSEQNFEKILKNLFFPK